MIILLNLEVNRLLSFCKYTVYLFVKNTYYKECTDNLNIFFSLFFKKKGQSSTWLGVLRKLKTPKSNNLQNVSEHWELIINQNLYSTIYT